MKELSLDVVKSQLSSKQKLLISEDTVAEIQKLAEDPDYGEEFLDNYIDHLNVYKEMPRASHDRYLSAVKFFTLIESGNSLTDSFIKTFPERFEARCRSAPPGKRDKALVRSEASRYNGSVMVNEIRKVATIPVQLIHRHLLHEAILVQADLMRNARSEMVKQKASDTLIRELKPTEDSVIQVKVEDGARTAIEELRLATERLAIAERQSNQAGVPLKTIAESKIYEGEYTDDGSNNTD